MLPSFALRTQRSKEDAMASQGPALTFDPRYVEFVIQVWQEQALAPIAVTDLTAAVRARAEDRFTALNAMGLHEEHVSDTQVSRAISLLKSIKVAKQTATGPKGASVAKLAATSLGQTLLKEAPVASGIRPELVRHLVVSSSELTRLLQALDQQGPVAVPVLNLIPGTQRRRGAYNKGVEDGLAQFWALPSQASHYGGSHGLSAIPGGKKPTPAQLIKQAQADALKRHAAAQVKSFDTVVTLASALGLVWRDTQQINPVVATRSIGSAAARMGDSYVPNVPAWDHVGSRFIQALIHAYTSRADGSGFATVEALRGALGTSLHIAPSVADALLRKAREEGDHGRVPVHLYFVENEDRMYAPDRHPLLWQGHAFDFVEVKPLAGSSPVGPRTNVTSYR